MGKEITYEQLRKELDDLPDVKRQIQITIDEENKKALTRRRSNPYGSASRN